MKIRPSQLDKALQKSLAKIYFIYGDEPLQMGESADSIRRRARQVGYESREVLTVEKGFSWGQLGQAADSFSIFSERKIIDLRLPEGKPGIEGGKALMGYCERPLEDTLLLVTSGKIAKSAQRTRWFQALEKAAVLIPVWPIEGRELRSWLQQRIQSRGMQVDQEGLGILFSRIEGNLLAGAQEVDKLYTLYGPAQLGATEIIDAVADSARYDVFKLVDSLLSGNIARAVRILQGLRGEGVAVPIVLWALTREARTLLIVRQRLKQGESRDSVFRQHQIWDQRKGPVENAMKRLSLSDLQQILIFSAKVDRQIKGAQPGDPWETLLSVCQVYVYGAERNLATLS